MQDNAQATISTKNEAPEATYLEKFIVKSKKRLKNILKGLRWDEETVQKNFNSNSPAIGTKLVSHTEKDPCFPPSFCARNSLRISQTELCSVVSDLNAVVPQRFSDLQLNFSREQKLCIYEYVVQNTQNLLEPELTVPVHDAKNSTLTFAEIVDIKKREKKQKRRKYRTTKPTHIEEVRNLVELQMQALEQYLKPNAARESSNESRKEYGRGRRKRSPSTESSAASHKKLVLKKYGTSNGQPVRSESSYSRRKRSASRARHRSRSKSRERYREKRKSSQSRIHGDSAEKTNSKTWSKSSNEKRRNRHDDYKSYRRRSRSRSRSHSRNDNRRKYQNYKSRSKSITSSVETRDGRSCRSKSRSPSEKIRNRHYDYKSARRRSRNKSRSRSRDESRRKYRNYKSRSKSRTSSPEVREGNSRQRHEDWEDRRRKITSSSHERHESKRKHRSERDSDRLSEKSRKDYRSRKLDGIREKDRR